MVGKRKAANIAQYRSARGFPPRIDLAASMAIHSVENAKSLANVRVSGVAIIWYGMLTQLRQNGIYIASSHFAYFARFNAPSSIAFCSQCSSIAIFGHVWIRSATMNI